MAAQFSFKGHFLSKFSVLAKFTEHLPTATELGVSCKNMNKSIAQVRVSTPEQLIAAGESFYDAWFRGQGESTWPLLSSLEREAEKYGVPSEAIIERENIMLALFQERAHLYINNSSLPDNKFEWLSLIRHYGGASRLLDVTNSYLVATYFALIDSPKNKDAVIWVFKDGIIKENYKNIDNISFNDKKPNLNICKPKKLNDRLHLQSGSFFVPSSVTTSLQDQIGIKYNTTFNKENIIKYRSVKKVKTENHHNIWKLIIPNNSKSNLFTFISRCNIRSYTLFPDIDGLCKSINEMMRAYD